MIVVDRILKRGDHEDLLIWGRSEELGLVIHRVLKLIQACADLRLEIENEYLFLLREDDLFGELLLGVLKIVLHGNLVEVRDIFNHYPLVQSKIIITIEIICSFSLEYEQLVLLLFAHNEVLT